MLDTLSLDILRGKKNLLAFSGGVDSTALFFLLIKQNIKFDIAIVDYTQRIQSKKEVEYAKSLAEKYHLTCHLHVAPQIEKNFESTARAIRYNFFEELISTCKYENLLTAHHLGDRFEWMLMQFCKGAGCAEIAGMQKVQDRDNYKLLRPLLHVDKQELYKYLHVENIHYFEDASNQDEEIKRNSFRHNHSAPLLDKYLNGIKKSFEYLDEDRQSLIPEVEIKRFDEISYFKSLNNKRSDIFIVDKILKSFDYMLSAKERELLKDTSTLIVGRKFVLNWDRGFVFIAPFIDEKIVMNHEFKERCRVLKIEPKIRPYLYKNRDAFNYFCEFFSAL